MEKLKFENITKNMKVLYCKDDEIYATRVVETTHGHPSIPMIRLHGGFTILYASRNKALYEDIPVHRTELLIEDKAVLTDLNTE